MFLSYTCNGRGRRTARVIVPLERTAGVIVSLERTARVIVPPERTAGVIVPLERTARVNVPLERTAGVIVPLIQRRREGEQLGFLSLPTIAEGGVWRAIYSQPVIGKLENQFKTHS